MSESVDAVAMLKRVAALREGHFLLSSGLHSDAYVQCALLCQHPRDVETAGRAMAANAPACDVVVSPAMGGIILGHEVARALGVRHVFTEREGGRMVLRRGFALAPNERVVVVEDVFTTGKSTREVFEVVRGEGAQVVAALSLVHRAEGDLAFGVPTFSLARLQLRTWSGPECPLCASGTPLVKPGSRPGGATHAG